MKLLLVVPVILSLFTSLWVSALSSRPDGLPVANSKAEGQLFSRELYEELLWEHLTTYRVSVKDGKDFVRMLQIFVSYP
jgi:hypothetical protein